MRTSGIYSVTNTVNGKRYVGKSCNVDSRLVGHRRSLQRGGHDNSHLQRAWKKYGEGVFLFELLEVVSDLKDLSRREAFWCKHFKVHDPAFGYNQGEVRGDEEEVLISDELRAKRSAAASYPMRDETRTKIGVANRGKKRTLESREKIRAARSGTRASQETREKMAASHQGRARSEDVVARIATSNRGKKRTPEQRARMVAAQARIKQARLLEEAV